MKNFQIEMEVRNNELDAQGIVNNANYMIYLSHARHKHILSLGINFDEFAKNKQNLVLLSCNMKFKNSLVAYDRFIVTSTIGKTEYPYQWAYHQDIKRSSDGKIIMKAIFYSTCVDGNKSLDEDRLYIPALIKELISPALLD